MPASIVATASRASGCVTSMPDASPTNRGCSGLIDTVIANVLWSEPAMRWRGQRRWSRQWRSPVSSGGFRLRDLQPGALDRGAAQIAHFLQVIEAPRPVHHGAIVPHHQVADAPGMRIDELPLGRVLGQVADEGACLGNWPADDAADMR